jgi:LysM repeat protein
VAVPALTGLNAVALACGTETATIGSMNGKVLRGMIPPGDAPVWLRVPRGCGARFDTALAALSDTARRGAEWRATKKGETPASIAKKAGITVKTLRRYNPKLKTDSEDWIKSGTQILIPDAATVKAARDVPDPSIERTGVAVGNSYTVMKGDTLGKIAERNHTTVAALKRVNGLKSDVLQIGQKLRVR